MVLSPKQKQQINDSIERNITSIRQQLKLSQESSQTVELDQTLAGRVSRIDAIQQQKMAQSSNARDNKRLLELETALESLANKDFGLCEECDELIPIARLKIKPESKLCIGCQALTE